MLLLFVNILTIMKVPLLVELISARVLVLSIWMMLNVLVKKIILLNVLFQDGEFIIVVITKMHL